MQASEAAVEANPVAPEGNFVVDKKVYFIRHGHSRYNQWRDRSWLPWACCPGLCIGDPLIFDAELSARGEAQLEGLRTRVREIGLDLSVELVVTTPLTRAIQTTMGAFDVEALRARGVSVVASGLHLEVCDTTCDIGTPLPELRATFRDSVSWESSVGIDGSPMLPARNRMSITQELEPVSEAEKTAPEQTAVRDEDAWWYGGVAPRNSTRRGMNENPWRSGSWSCRRLPCCQCCCPPLIDTETDEEVAARIKHFKVWVENRPERVIVVVGHSAFFQQFIRTQTGPENAHFRKLSNCEILDCSSVGVKFG